MSSTSEAVPCVLLVNNPVRSSWLAGSAELKGGGDDGSADENPMGSSIAEGVNVGGVIFDDGMELTAAVGMSEACRLGESLLVADGRVLGKSIGIVDG